MMRVLGGVILGIIIYVVSGYFIYQAGYDKCAAENEKSAAERAVEDAKAVTTIKLEQVKDREKTERIRTVIKRVPDPSGCADTAVPVERVERMRDAYNTAGTRSGIDDAGQKGDAGQ